VVNVWASRRCIACEDLAPHAVIILFHSFHL
jgi:hypothetical protein